MVVGTQPVKRVKQNISDYLTTSKNLKSADTGLKNAYSGVVSNMAGESTKAAEGAQAKTQEVAGKTSEGALASGVPKLDTSSYTQGSQGQSGYKSVGTLEDANNPDKRAQTIGQNVTNAQQAAGNTAATAKEGLNKAVNKSTDELNDWARQQTRTLDQGTTKILDSAGKTIGSNAGIGQVAQMGGFESGVLGNQEALASGVNSTSNIDALRSLLGMGYDPRLAGMNSQVYQGDIATAKGQAAQEVTQQGQAEANRTSSMEGYLKELEAGKKRVGEAQTKASKDITDKQTAAQDQIDKNQQNTIALIDKFAKQDAAAPGVAGDRAVEAFNKIDLNKGGEKVAIAAIKSAVSKGMGKDAVRKMIDAYVAKIKAWKPTQYKTVTPQEVARYNGFEY